MPDYTLFYKKKFAPVEELKHEASWDLFISAYNNSERVRTTFDLVTATRKDWLLLPEYQYAELEVPQEGNTFSFEPDDTESELIVKHLEAIPNLSALRVCVDITGFMRPHVVFLLKYLSVMNVKKFDVLYSDPLTYAKKEKTTFTKDLVDNVRQIAGCEGQHDPDNSNDVLLIGSGYDHKLIASVAENKANARKIQMFGFPSLQADMYQENLLRAHIANEAIGGRSYFESPVEVFAPANDPFVTASVIQTFVDAENRLKKISNLYLCPLSTKAQTLGFALYFLWECQGLPASIIFPFCHEYSRETSIGLSRIWKYTVELP
jgi:hypothetical protein